jgi:hypothetical protein
VQPPPVAAEVSVLALEEQDAWMFAAWRASWYI